MWWKIPLAIIPALVLFFGVPSNETARSNPQAQIEWAFPKTNMSDVKIVQFLLTYGIPQVLVWDSASRAADYLAGGEEAQEAEKEEPAPKPESPEKSVRDSFTDLAGYWVSEDGTVWRDE